MLELVRRKFQFQNGTIKSQIADTDFIGITGFQFQNGTIKSC